MKTTVLLALIGKTFALLSAEPLSPLGASPHSSLMLVGLAGLALVTLRSERWRTQEQTAR